MADEDDSDEEDIEEDIQTDRDDNLLGVGKGLAESGGGQNHAITMSQSLGVDPSVDSLAIEEFDHVEAIQ